MQSSTVKLVAVILSERSLARPERNQIDGGAVSIFAALFRNGLGIMKGGLTTAASPMSWVWGQEDELVFAARWVTRTHCGMDQVDFPCFYATFFTGNKKCDTLFPACRKLQKHDLIPTLSGRTLIDP